ncbi:IpaD/SipD/SspD family type III secretion system needle tip protein (plasmid) [Pantoea sp. BJ2]|uniref:IpaD/SipD/SspD family type III secretion system needle tip protein n=1 Tax=Pantoea sp. BJ2 TaxID=3141322 RepID=A0AAU7U3Y9_9GAMM
MQVVNTFTTSSSYIVKPSEIDNQEASPENKESLTVAEENTAVESPAHRGSAKRFDAAARLKELFDKVYARLVDVADKAQSEPMLLAMLEQNESIVFKREILKRFKDEDHASDRNLITQFKQKIQETAEESEYHALKNLHYSTSSDMSDQDIADAISQLIDEMQKNFLDPFMSATQKMTAWYETLSKLNELVTQYTKPGKDPNEVEINAKALMDAMDKMMSAFGDTTLFEGKSADEAKAWCEKMGVGKVVGNKVVIDTSGFQSFKQMAANLLGNSSDKKLSMTEWNNFKSSMDTFLQREQGRVNKIFSQLEYYNKLLTNVREVLAEFITKVTETAMRFVHI